MPSKDVKLFFSFIPSALPRGVGEWKINIFKIIDSRILFYSCDTNRLNIIFLTLNAVHCIIDFHMKYVLFPADKAEKNDVVVCDCIMVIL